MKKFVKSFVAMVLAICAVCTIGVTAFAAQEETDAWSLIRETTVKEYEAMKSDGYAMTDISESTNGYGSNSITYGYLEELHCGGYFYTEFKVFEIDEIEKFFVYTQTFYLDEDMSFSYSDTPVSYNYDTFNFNEVDMYAACYCCR